MSRTILDIAKEAAERENTAPPPETLFGSNNRVSRILRVAIHDTMRDVMRSSVWVGLSDLFSTWALVLKPGRYAYPLPPDFLRMIPNTDLRGGWPVGRIGEPTPDVLAGWLRGQGVGYSPLGWRIRNNMIVFDPTPTVEEIVTIDYITKYPVVAVAATTDLDASVPPNVKGPAVSRDGALDGQLSRVLYDQQGTGFDYGTAPGWDAATWTGEMSDILKHINPLTTQPPYFMVRRPEFTADTDLPAFSDDHLLSLGMTMRLRRGMGLSYAEIAAEYEAELELRIPTDAGGSRSFIIGAGSESDDVTPLGGGRWLVQ